MRCVCRGVQKCFRHVVCEREDLATGAVASGATRTKDARGEYGRANGQRRIRVVYQHARMRGRMSKRHQCVKHRAHEPRVLRRESEVRKHLISHCLYGQVVVPSLEAPVHHVEPQRRHEGNDDHGWISKRKLWTLIVVIQHLIAFMSMNVMVRMTL